GVRGGAQALCASLRLYALSPRLSALLLLLLPALLCAAAVIRAALRERALRAREQVGEGKQWEEAGGGAGKEGGGTVVSGKSTVAALLERFYEPTCGSITLDGRDIASLDPSWLRGHVIGFISQEPVLFGTSIMENIRFGKPGASDEEVFAAARAADADAFIRAFPDGYGTVVGERGAALSGGQRQRVALARALLKGPAVLLLDEATSALDAESERAVQAALERAARGRTVLLIAHRLSTVRGAHRIAVLAGGRVAEIFTRLGKCYTFNSGQPGTELLTTLQGGAGNGLELMLNIQQEEYLPVWGDTDETSYEAGVKVQIHSQQEPPFIDQLGFGVAPGFQTFVSCQQQRPSRQLVYLPPPWGDCKATPIESDFFTNYSLTACRLDCETRYLAENCNCRMVHMP
ncbi:UNVERIFIED_CONTAM: hypothetical protein H355_012616, partial [Colinus virginianus]